ncbi:NDP-hexose 2,3-dehydratase family protein [Kutzneria viridogrisea]|uniref:NDP-hexose 2,3-dehydratase family protein n=1 Tax=Kutzneria viridogrisea TaxID=47990 RepID=UPI0016034436
MTDVAAASSHSASASDSDIHLRIAGSALSSAGQVESLSDFNRWLVACGEENYTHVEKVPLADLERWHIEPETGNIGHDSGKFFTVEGLDVQLPEAAVSSWTQPIINQPEVGILGILVKEFHGVLHCLMQAKVEPGNFNGVQLSPTVQATKSNYTKVHQGKSVPYLEYFRDRSRPHRVIADVRQSEQGSWFHQKRNRNIIIEVFEDVELLEGFCWLTIGQVHELLAVEDLINMDARTVLSCLPFAGAQLPEVSGDGFRASLVRSCGEEFGSAHSTGEVLTWITDARTRYDVDARRIPLNQVRNWCRSDELIWHESGAFFNVIGVNVKAGGREVAQWMQPMIEPLGIGVVAVLVKRINGVLHALMHTRVEPGYLDVIELAPTVQCTPENYDLLPSAARPPFLDEVLGADPAAIRYETVLSEEGGRFYHARNRYLVVETEREISPEEHPDYRWLSLGQLAELLRHSHYVNIQARSLIACMHSLWSPQTAYA